MMKELNEDLIPNYILEDLHEFIYDECNRADIEVDENGIGHLSLEYEKDEWYFDINVEYSAKYIDDSFTHEFGIYYDGHYEFSQIEDLIVHTSYYDEDSEIELNINFPYDRFDKKLFRNKDDSDDKRKLKLQQIIACYEEERNDE